MPIKKLLRQGLMVLRTTSHHRRLLLRLASMDFRKRYLGTLLGGLWAVISPLVTIALIYFVFNYGLKVGRMGNVSFDQWLIPAMLAWFFMSEILASGVIAIIENSHLVSKMQFPLWLLPPAKILSGLPVHLVLMFGFLVYMVAVGDGTPGYWVQLGYYLCCACMLGLGIIYFSCAVQVFVRDMSAIVGVVIQILFWATPIFWDPKRMEGGPVEFLLYSPFNYIITGYRDSLFGGVAFWNRPMEGAVFWLTTLLFLAIGIQVFRKSRPHFADVL
jgi:ABC-type polysaccharide/polyol phosphate export permease